MKIGIIGYGYWGKILAQSLLTLPQVKKIVVVDRENIGLTQLFFDKRIEQISLQNLWVSQLDGVVIATPEETHYELAKQCLQHGTACLVEKPLALRIDEVEELVALAQQKQLLLMSDQVFLYDHHFQQFVGLVKAKLSSLPSHIISYRAAPMYRPKKVNVIVDTWIHDLYQLRVGFGLHILRIDQLNDRSINHTTATANTANTVTMKAAMTHDASAEQKNTWQENRPITYQSYLSWRGTQKIRRLTFVDKPKNTYIEWIMGSGVHKSLLQVWQNNIMTEQIILPMSKQSPVDVMLNDWLVKLTQPWIEQKQFLTSHWDGLVEDVGWLEKANLSLCHHE